MTQQVEGSEEPQVDPVTAPLDSEQVSLDAEQAGEPAPPQFVTMDQWNALQGQNAQLQRHISGLESRLDKGINTLGSNLQELTAAAAKKEIELREQALLSSIEDPDERARMQTMLELQNLRTPQQPVQQQPVATPEPAQQQADADRWAQIEQYVSVRGVDPKNPKVNYTVLTDETKTLAQREAIFMQSIVDAGTPNGQQAAPPPQSQQAPAPQPQNPQRPAGPAGSGYRNWKEVQDAFIAGRIPTTNEGRAEYKRLAAQFGEDV